MRMSYEDQKICQEVLKMSSARMWTLSRSDYLDAGIMEDLADPRLEGDGPPWQTEAETHQQRCAYVGLYGEDRPKD